MELKIERLSAEQNTETNLMFLKEGGSWADRIIDYFSEFKALTYKSSFDEILSAVKAKMESAKDGQNNIIKEFQAWWNEDIDKDVRELLNAMELDESFLSGTITWQISMCPICPRFIKEKKFSMPTEYWKWSAIQVALHEICHFVWFEKVGKLENVEDFESLQESDYLPHWFLSEMVIEPVLCSLKFADEYEMTWKSYDEFYEIEAGGVNIMDYINKLWMARTDFVSFYRQARAFILSNFDEINEKYMSFF